MAGSAAQKDGASFYHVLGVKPHCKDVEIRRAYRNLVSKHHPDKPGGDANLFREIQQAYAVLNDPAKRRQYDATGTWERTAEDDFVEAFAGGAFRDRVREAEQQPRRDVLTELVAVRDKESQQSHSSGFEAWMRSRGENGTRVFTSEDVMEQYGVVKSSYDAVPLPKLRVHSVTCSKLGTPKEVLQMDSVPLPPELEWGQCLVSIRATPISPADLFTIQTGVYGKKAAEPPFTPGIAGVGVVAKLGPGCKHLSEGDWVLPLETNLGCWRTLMVVKEKDLLRIPAECQPLEQLACIREQLTAYRLLEESGLKAGDAIILNAANSCTAQYILQLCAVLRLRAVAVVSREHEEMEKMRLWLTALGAAQVLVDEGSLKLALEQQKFFAKPKVALDAVGGASAARLADALAEGGTLVTYGVMSGKSPAFHWRDWLVNGLQVRGFNLNRWVKDNKKKIGGIVESLGKLVNDGKLKAETTEYELATEFSEALEHAMERHRNTKVVLRVTDVGEAVA